MNYKEALDFLYSQLPMYQRVGAPAMKKDLTNTLSFCEHLGNPERKFPSIHIAGTNGKGSVTHILAALFMANGLKVGVYTSPHYKDFRERIKINGELIPEKYVTGFVEDHKAFTEALQPSFFEWTVAMAFEYFAKDRVDLAIIETGLGGRLDSTNVITPLLSVITNIGFDHMQFLGDTLPLIAAEKAGIIKNGVPVLIGEYQELCEMVFRSKANELRSNLRYSSEIYEIQSYKWNVKGSELLLKDVQLDQVITIKSDLCGPYQDLNIRTALAAYRLLEDEHQLQTDALKHIRRDTAFIGRWQMVSESPLILADSAHNKEGLELAIKGIQEFDVKQWHIVFGTVSDKDLSKVFPILPASYTYYFCKPDIPRGKDAAILTEEAHLAGLRGDAYSSVTAALEAAKTNLQKDEAILVCGSIFVVAEVL